MKSSTICGCWQNVTLNIPSNLTLMLLITLFFWFTVYFSPCSSIRQSPRVKLISCWGRFCFRRDMLLQDRTDAGPHWPRHNFYSVSLHAEESRYLNYLKKKNEEKWSIQRYHTGCPGSISHKEACPCWRHCDRRKKNRQSAKEACVTVSQWVTPSSELALLLFFHTLTHTHTHSSLVHTLLCIQMASEHPFFWAPACFSSVNPHTLTLKFIS